MAQASFRDLRVWREAVDLAVDICSRVRQFDAADRFGLGVQLERSSVSVPSNIAEGSGRHTLADRKRFYVIARGSLNELETQVVIAGRLKLIDAASRDSLLSNIRNIARALAGLIRSTNTNR